MSINSDIITALSSLNIPIETGIFSGKAPDTYIVITPMTDTLPLWADNKPVSEISEARISLFTKNNYLANKNAISRLLLQADFTITDRVYVGFEEETKYHNYAIDLAKEYIFEGEI